MLESLVKNPLIDLLKEKSGLSAGQSEKAGLVTTETLKNDLRQEVMNGNYMEIQKLLEGKTKDNKLYNRLSDSVVSRLMPSMDLLQQTAEKIARISIPFVMEKISAQTGGKASSRALSKILDISEKEKFRSF